MATRDLSADEIAALWARPAVGLNDAAALAGIGLSTLRRLIDRGELPARRVGGRVFIPTDSLRDLLVGPAGDGAA